jgi:hypothetical protein
MANLASRVNGPGAAVAAAAATIGLSLLAAGCGGSPSAAVAQLGPTTTSTNASASTGGSSRSDPQAYPKCMRKHGVTQFPDAGAHGELRLTVGPGTGLDPNSALFKSAEKACRDLQPKGGRPPSPQQRAKDLQKMLDFSRCMRSHGVPGFPDPKASADGGIQLGIGRNSGVDPNSAQFRAAQQTCQKLMPGPDGKAGSTDSSQGPGGFATPGGKP